MQRLIYAFRFIKACFSLAIKHTQLRKPLVYLWMGGISLSVMWLIPLGVVMVLVGINPLGMMLIGLISSLLLFSLLTWGEIAALEICPVFDSLIQSEDKQPETEKHKPEFSHWQDVALWVLGLPGLLLIRFLRKIFRPTQAARLDWLGASYLILPVVSLEALSLAEAIARIKQLIRDHLLRFHPDIVRVRPVVGVFQWVLVLAGGILGFRVGSMMVDQPTVNALTLLLAAAVGILLAGFLATLGIFLSSFIRACYFTTLYHWALSVETARSSGVASQGKPPGILSQVMRKTIPSKKE